MGTKRRGDLRILHSVGISWLATGKQKIYERYAYTRKLQMYLCDPL